MVRSRRIQLLQIVSKTIIKINYTVKIQGYETAKENKVSPDTSDQFDLSRFLPFISCLEVSRTRSLSGQFGSFPTEEGVKMLNVSSKNTCTNQYFLETYVLFLLEVTERPQS